MSSQEVERIEEILKTIAVIPVDSRIARIAGSLRQKYHLKVPDSAIAATALFTGTTLVTRNIKDFKKIPNLKLLKI
jgi:predicted nucleic acid-binding protein